MKKLFPVLSFCLALCLALASPALAVTLEQVQASPPRFDVYVYDEGADLGSVSAADVTATLGDQALECTDVSQSEQGIFYFFMLDISGSIPSAHFEAAKAAVLDTYASLREQDKLAVITFGNDVTLLLDGDESKESRDRANEVTEDTLQSFNSGDATFGTALGFPIGSGHGGSIDLGNELKIHRFIIT